MKTLFASLVMIALSLSFPSAQTVIVNPDGSHSIGIDHGSTSIIVHSDGSHSVGINHGTTTTIVNPDGTHSVAINHGSTTTVVNSDGTHSVGINHGNTTTIVNPDGTHSIGINHNNASTIDNPDITHALHGNSVVDENKEKEESYNARYLDQLLEENALFLMESESYKDERVKLKILRQRRFISRKEYKALNDQNLANQNVNGIDKANQIFNARKDFELEQITYEAYIAEKYEIINQ